jgi:hypothetical protein
MYITIIQLLLDNIFLYLDNSAALYIIACLSVASSIFFVNNIITATIILSQQYTKIYIR